MIADLFKPYRNIAIFDAKREWKDSKTYFDRVLSRAYTVYYEYEEMCNRYHKLVTLMLRVISVKETDDLASHRQLIIRQHNDLERDLEWLIENEIPKFIKPLAECLRDIVEVIQSHGNYYTVYNRYTNNEQAIYAGSKLLLNSSMRTELFKLGFEPHDVDVQMAFLEYTDYCYNIPTSDESAITMCLVNADTPELRAYITNNRLEFACIKELVKNQRSIPDWLIGHHLPLVRVCELLDIDPKLDLKPFANSGAINTWNILDTLKDQYPSVDFSYLDDC